MMNLEKVRRFTAVDFDTKVVLHGDGTYCPRLTIDGYVSSGDLYVISEQLKKWAKKLEKAELGN